MASVELMNWALPRIQKILPLDDASLKEVINYNVTLSKDAGAEHLGNMLGDSQQAFEFISSFNARRPEIKQAQPVSEAQTTPSRSDGVPRHQSKPKTKKPPLHSAGPVRKPEGYGDVSGGYTKGTILDDEMYTGRTHKRGTSGTILSENLSLSQQPEALQVPTTTQGGLQTPQSGRSRDPSPRPSVSMAKQPPSAAGKLISDMLPNVRTKASKKPAPPTHSGTIASSGKGSTTTTSSIADLTSAIAALELSTNPKLSTERRKCDCNASIHPLFATAPNCLSCGKIICALEGLQPCSFCDAPILSRDQVNSMIRALKDERGIERQVVHNTAAGGSRGATPQFGNSPNVSDDEGDAAARARMHRDKLLNFQRENAQRTKVHDEAADYDATLTPGATQWMSPVQRAAALKRQQAYLREMEDMNRPEWERKRTVMSMSVKNGKLVRTFEKVNAPKVTDNEADEQELDADIEEADNDLLANRSSGGGAFSKNPLLKSGKLIRPVWKPADGVTPDNGKDRERKSVWRRVQDDNDDNEQWILDGGLKGYGSETRMMEDGSQQEHG